MKSLVLSAATAHSPESLAESLRGHGGLVVLRSGCFEIPQARYSLVAVRPFLTLRSKGHTTEVRRPGAAADVHFGNPWRLLDVLLARYELPDEIDLPFPLGGAFGFLGYELRRFLEPRCGAGSNSPVPVPDCWIGFYSSLIVFDHRTGSVFVVATGLQPDGSRNSHIARRQAEWWLRALAQPLPAESPARSSCGPTPVVSNMDKAGFCAAVKAAQRLVRAGDIYQVNLSQCLRASIPDAWHHWRNLVTVSPAPFSAFISGDGVEIASTSPELFLKLSGRHIVTRPIKGTRPRSADPTTDAQLTYELQTSPKEIAELVMITDLLRNDLGRVCEFGSIHVPDLLRLERYAQVQHLVSTVEGTLRPEVTHLAALEACFPGGSITGAPKIRAMEIIEALEPHARGPYTGCAGYLGFNQETQLNILIRTSVVHHGQAWYHAGAGIVADSDPAAEFDETLAKARAFMDAVCAPTGPLPILAPPDPAESLGTAPG